METVELDLEVVCTTDLAVLVDDGDREEWIPRSVIEEPDWEDIKDSAGSTIMITMSEKFAIKKELV